ncbi:MAG: ring-cleaving dioxygenase [Bauldia sp.]|nr:ring-cleaving dioxygenase [Bauldia sp.]
MELTGIHHLTAVSADAPGNVAFYTQKLGMRLVKKTVNQDQTTAYHLFYADGAAHPGTDLTFFDFPTGPERRGTHSISRTGLRVADEKSLLWWQDYLKAEGIKASDIKERNGRPSILFEDPEGQRLALVADSGPGLFTAWDKSTIPAEHQIRGLGPITLSVPDLAPTERILTQVMNMREVRDYPHPGNGGGRVHVFEMGPGGAGAELHVHVDPGAPAARQGAGGVHHVAFRTPDDKSHAEWLDRLARMGVRSTGRIDRFYFRSLYFREPNGILFEIATDGPGFAADEPMEHLGEKLALPPFLEPQRAEIEAGLKPL